MENIRRFFADKDQLAKHLGFEIVDVAKGNAKVRMTVSACHLNGVGTVHGGTLFSLADFAFAIASNSHGRVAVGINASMSYVKAATGGVLYAEAREISLNYKLGNYKVDILDEENQLIAVFQGTAYRKAEEHKW